MKKQFTFRDKKINQETWEDFIKRAWYYSKCIKRIDSIEIGTIEVEIDEDEEILLDEVLYSRFESLLKDLALQNRVSSKTLLEVKRKDYNLFHDNIMDELLSRGDLYEYEKGRYAYSGIVKELMEYFDKLFVDLGDPEQHDYEFPTTVSWNILNRCSYVSEFPNNLTFLSALPKDTEVYNQYSKKPVLNPEVTESMGLFFSPTVCVHLYEILKEKTLENNYYATAKGKCYRNEYIKNSSLERLKEFSMRELIFIGNKEFVMNAREQIMKKTIELVEQINFDGKVAVATDPFFTSKHINKLFHQKLSQLKYELRLDINSKGDSISVASFNVHKSHFTDAFNIKVKDYEEVWTGCCAYGLERWVYAFLNQKGLNSEEWQLNV